MRVTYIGRNASVLVPDLQSEVQHGETVEVPDELGAAMVSQPANWRQEPEPDEETEPETAAGTPRRPRRTRQPDGEPAASEED